MDEEERILLQRIAHNARAAATQGRQVIEVGPFTALLDRSSDIFWRNRAVPTAPLTNTADTLSALRRLRLIFAEHGRRLYFEFVEELWPTLPALLEQAGLMLLRRDPLLVCTPASFQPVNAPGVTVRLMQSADDDALLDLYLSIQEAGFDERDELRPVEESEIALLRGRLNDTHIRCILAYLNGSPAGAGSSVLAEGMAELAGITTLPRYRRRGVAVTLSSALVEDHFSHGGTLVWLSAADAGAQAVYERIGFRLIGKQVNFISKQ